MESPSSHSHEHAAYLAPTLGPEPKTSASSITDEKNTPTQQWSARPARPRLLGLIGGVVVALGSLCFAAALLAVLLVTQCKEMTNGSGFLAAIRDEYFYTVAFADAVIEPTGTKVRMWGVMISNFASQFIAATSSIVMALIAYRVGLEWLHVSNSPSPTSAAEAPSPAQYGLLVRLLGSTGIRSIWDASSYTRRTRGNAPLPPMFRKSVFLVSTLWVLTRLVAAVDSWLHGQTSALWAPITEPDRPELWGVAFNSSICDDMVAQNASYYAQWPSELKCRLANEYFVNNIAWGNAIGFNVTMNQTDAAFHVGTVDSNATSFAFPGPKFVDMSSYNFVIPTLAAQANCTSINHLCLEGDGGYITNCSAAGFSQLPYYDSGDASTSGRIVNHVFGFVDGQMVGTTYGSVDANTFPENPANSPIAVQLQWETLEQGATSGSEAAAGSSDAETDENRAVYGSLYNLPTMYASCDLRFYNAYVAWNSTAETWSLLNLTTPEVDVATALWEPVVFQYATEHLAANLMYTARTSSVSEAMDALGENLARLSISTAAGFYTTVKVSDVSETYPEVVIAYPVAPVLIFLLLLVLYALLTLYIFISAYRMPDQTLVTSSTDGPEDIEVEKSMGTLAQRWLTDPRALVGSSFAAGDGRDGPRSAAHHPMKALFDGGEDQARLAIGLNGDRFGVATWGKRHA